MCNKSCKTYECLDTKNCFCIKLLTGKLVLECEDEVLNTTKTLPKKVTCGKSNCLRCTILLVIMCLLLLVVIRFSY